MSACALRDLHRANVFVEDDGTPWMIDFGFSEVAVDQTILDADVAQMLSSLAVVVGAIPRRLPVGQLVTASFGSSFTSKVAPAGLGGMALNIRFLQKQGGDRKVAVTGIAMPRAFMTSAESRR